LVDFFDINEWNSPAWAKHPKGSRAQRMVEHPETGEVYYFKKSHHNYSSEVWSEIIASKIGQTIGFNVLDYNIALRNGELGCLSKNMINPQQGEILYHGVDVLNDYFDDFVISDKPTFSFQEMKILCAENQEFNSFLERFIEVCLFDTLIGNTDRHTENWAFILNKNKPKIDVNLDDNKGCLSLLGILPKLFREKNWQYLKNQVRFKSAVMDLTITTPISFAPIYDSGSCLGREMDEERIVTFINNEQQIERYLKGGKSEIKWLDKNDSFFIFTEKIFSEEKELVINCAKKIFDNLTNEKIQDIVENADNCIKNTNIDTLLSQNRKKLIIILLQRRLQNLKNIIKID
jgi:hypothetical protein